MTPAPPQLSTALEAAGGERATAVPRPGWRHVVALVIVVAGLFVCYGSVLREGADFAILLAVCGAMGVGVSGLGAALGARLGSIVGLSISIGLCTHSHASLMNQMLFSAIATAACSLIGWLAGSRPPGGDTATMPSDARRQDGAGSLGNVTSLASAFQRWVAEGRINWRSFDQFVRTALRETCTATHVRSFHVGRGLTIRPLSNSAQEDAIGLSESDRELLSALLTAREPIHTGRAQIPTEKENGRAPHDAAAHGAAAAPRLSDAEWLIPVSDNNAVVGIVAIGALGRSIPEAARPALVEALARTLSLCWVCVRVRRRLSAARGIDRPSGAMTRERLLADCERVARAAADDGEPLTVVILGIEGVRRLDDEGLWQQRDRLIDRLGRVVRRTLRTDDLLGRFSDDRFVVVLRRVDATLGELISRKLLEAARGAVAGRPPGAARGGEQSRQGMITVRAGSASFASVTCDASSLISAAMSCLDEARQQQRELVCRRVEPARFVPVTEPGCGPGCAERDVPIPHEV